MSYPESATQLNYRELLKKYIAHVGECEGVTFIPSYIGKDGWHNVSGIAFSEEEVSELETLDEESKRLPRTKEEP